MTNTTTVKLKTRSQQVAEDVCALLRSRNPLLWVVTNEEARVERYLVEAAAAAGYITRMWDVGVGVTEIDGRVDATLGGVDPGDTLRTIGERSGSSSKSERCVWVMRDLHSWIAPPVGATVLRQLRNLARALPGVPREKAQAVVVLTPSTDIPPELRGHATVIEWPLPDREEIAATLDAAVEALPEDVRTGALSQGSRDAAIDSAVGLTREEAASCFAKSLVQNRFVSASAVANEKRRVISRDRVLEWVDPISGGLDAVGGLENLKGWLVSRSMAYTPAARQYGLPMPKGALLAGIPGCGKSLIAKAIATAWNVPLLRLDMGALRSKFVGESEANLRKAFKVIEAIGRCVVWLDEIEKAMQGATSGSSDGGVSADALGAVLSWMQDRQGEAFVIATANDVEGLPPELTRKGRFDEVWWVDLPTDQERVSVLQAALRQYGCRDVTGFEGVAVTDCAYFSGAEVAAIVPDAMFRAFADGGRAVAAADLTYAATNVVPMSTMAAEKIKKLRDWAKGRARPASAKAIERAASTDARQLDL